VTSLVVTGATGRMGRELLAAAADRELTVAGATSRTAETVAGVSTAAPEALGRLAREAPSPTVVVDFTAPQATTGYAETVAEAGAAFLTGTTGLSESDHASLARAGERVPVLWASNFSRGVAALRRAVTAAVDTLPGYDVEVTETHHDGKRDAPSGTAETLVETVEDARPDLSKRVHGRDGVAPRSETEIGVHARRAGDVAGEHEVLLAGDDNVVELTHRAGSRRVFAAGALDAAAWLAGRDPGVYGFEDVLDADDPAAENGGGVA
jgi:dihydrodipicolinate reductase (EC 1.3.1.26)